MSIGYIFLGYFSFVPIDLETKRPLQISPQVIKVCSTGLLGILTLKIHDYLSGSVKLQKKYALSN